MERDLYPNDVNPELLACRADRVSRALRGDVKPGPGLSGREDVDRVELGVLQSCLPEEFDARQQLPSLAQLALRLAWVAHELHEHEAVVAYVRSAGVLLRLARDWGQVEPEWPRSMEVVWPRSACEPYVPCGDPAEPVRGAADGQEPR